MLPWRPEPPAAGGVGEVSLARFQALRGFSMRLGLDPQPALLPYFQQLDPFQLILSGVSWSRILTELRDSGLCEALNTSGARVLIDLAQAMFEVNLDYLDLLLLTPADLVASETFDTPGAPGRMAVSARCGQSRAPAIPATPPTAGPEGLRFIHLDSLPMLQAEGASAPSKSLARLLGMLGPRSTRVARSRLALTVSV
ncbi:MAG: hypothetical protein SGPRY_006423, partial [Prymnesium sp.]